MCVEYNFVSVEREREGAKEREREGGRERERASERRGREWMLRERERSAVFVCVCKFLLLR